jgi:hypothetical protein
MNFNAFKTQNLPTRLVFETLRSSNLFIIEQIDLYNYSTQNSQKTLTHPSSDASLVMTHDVAEAWDRGFDIIRNKVN